MSTSERMNESDPKLQSSQALSDPAVLPPQPSEPKLEATDKGTVPLAPRTKPRGFAAMDPAAVRAIARKGGVTAHERGTAHRFTRAEAQEAGRKGGLAPHRTRGDLIRRPEPNDDKAPGPPGDAASQPQ